MTPTRIRTWACVLGLATCAPVQAQPVDVSAQVAISYSGYVFNRSDGTFDTQATLTNSLIAVKAPLQLIVSGLPSGVTLANASGVTSGSPYITVNVPGGVLAPGASATTVLRFANPGRLQISFGTEVLAVVQSETSTTSVLAAVDSSGSTLTLPSIATLRVPKGAVSSAAIRFSTTTVQNFRGLLSQKLPDLSAVSAPALHIKSSSALQGALYLQQTIPGLSAQVAAGSAPHFIAVSLEQELDASYTDIRSIGGELCALDTICVIVPTYAFNPVSSDPKDPDLVLAVAIGPGTSGKQTALWKLNSQNNPGATVGATSVEFDAELLFAPDFSFQAGSPLASLSITSAFKQLRVIPGTMPRPHRGDDLHATIDTPVFAPIPGTLVVPYNQPENGAAPNCTPPVGPIHHDYIKHIEHLQTRYLHIDPANQPPQATAAAAAVMGDAFAKSGTSGACSGGVPAPHLHFELLMNGTQVDPRPLLPTVNNLGMYLLPPDSSDAAAGNLATSRMYVLLFVDGVAQDPSSGVGQEEGEVRFPSLYTLSDPIPPNGGELQNETITPKPPATATSSYLTLSKPTADLFYKSGPVNLANMIAAAAGGTNPASFVTQHRVEVRQIIDNFRFGRIYQAASWTVSLVKGIFARGINSAGTLVGGVCPAGMFFISEEGECAGQLAFSASSPLASIGGQLTPLQGYLGPCGFDQSGQTIAVAVADGGAIVVEGQKTVDLGGGNKGRTQASCLLKPSANGLPPFSATAL